MITPSKEGLVWQSELILPRRAMTQGTYRPENMHTLWSVQQWGVQWTAISPFGGPEGRSSFPFHRYTHSLATGSHLVSATALAFSFPDLPQSFLFVPVWALDYSEQSSIEAGQRPEHRSNCTYCSYWTLALWSALGTIFDDDKLEFTQKVANRNVRRG